MADMLLIEDHDGVRRLLLNRPQRRNALCAELIAQLVHALAAARSDASVAALVLAGRGPAFCAGLDLDELEPQLTGGQAADISPFVELLEALESCPKPLVAAVGGPATAGGATLALTCDCVVAGAAARFGYPGIARGLVAPVVVEPLVRAVGPRRARRLLLTGELVAAREAAALGLCDEVVPDNQLEQRAQQCARRLAEIPAAAVARWKQLLAAGQTGDRRRVWRASEDHSV